MIFSLSSIFKYLKELLFETKEEPKFEKPRGYKNVASHELCF